MVSVTLLLLSLLSAVSLSSSRHETSAKPLILNSSAVFNNDARLFCRTDLHTCDYENSFKRDKKEKKLTCSTLISPLYMNSTKYLMSINLTSFSMMMGSFSLLQFVRMESKYVLHADNTTRCAFNVCPSQAKVTSQKQPLSRSCENIVWRLLWWYFHLKQYCCGNMAASTFLSASTLCN